MFAYLLTWLRLNTKSEKGQDAAEYAMLIGLIALIVVVGITALGLNLQAVFDDIATRAAAW